MDTITMLFLIIGACILLWIGYRLGASVKEQEWNEKLPGLREDSVKKSREVLTGSFSEQLAPFMPDFPFSPTECRFIGKPVDLIVFKGMDKGEPEEVFFVEIKSGEASLSKSERKLKEIVLQKKVSWLDYRYTGKKPEPEKETAN